MRGRVQAREEGPGKGRGSRRGGRVQARREGPGEGRGHPGECQVSLFSAFEVLSFRLTCRVSAPWPPQSLAFPGVLGKDPLVLFTSSKWLYELT